MSAWEREKVHGIEVSSSVYDQLQKSFLTHIDMCGERVQKGIFSSESALRSLKNINCVYYFGSTAIEP